LKVDQKKPKNFDDLVKVEKLRYVIKVNQEKLSKSKSEFYRIVGDADSSIKV